MVEEHNSNTAGPVVNMAAAAGLLEALPDGVALVDSSGVITYVSGPLTRMTGYTNADLVGQVVETLVPQRFHGRHTKQRNGYQEAPEARPMGAALEISVNRKDGTEFPADIALKPVSTAEGRAVMAVVRDVTERRAQQTLLRANQQRMALVEDRERIGRELHDGTIQALFGIGMTLQAAAMAAADAGARERMEATVGQLDAVIRDLRNYVFELKPTALASQSLARAIGEIAVGIESEVGIAVAADIEAAAAVRLKEHEASVLQVVREGLSNIARHAHASTCRISLRSDSSGIVLEVDDDGRGFDVAAARGRGHGLKNLAERARDLGGELSVVAGPGGTTIRIVISGGNPRQPDPGHKAVAPAPILERRERPPKPRAKGPCFHGTGAPKNRVQWP